MILLRLVSGADRGAMPPCRVNNSCSITLYFLVFGSGFTLSQGLFVVLSVTPNQRSINREKIMIVPYS